MVGKIIFTLFFLNLNILLISGATDKVICYYASWAYVREGNGKFLPEDIDPNLCTHVLYSFLGLQPNGSLQLLDPWFDVQLDGLNRVSKLKEKNPNFKCILSLGGWNAGGATFTAISQDPAKIKAMANSAIEFIKKYNFDGLDIDWEYPLPNEKDNFVNLLAGIKEAFKPHNYLLTIAVSAIPTDHGYDPKKFSEILDIINIMTYDFHGSWNDVTGQNSPLYASKIDQPWQKDNLNGNSSITHWIEQGADPQKLAIGMGFYGHSFTLADPNNHGLGAKVTGPGPKGPYTKTDGSLGYNEICEFHKNGKVVFDNEQKVPYMYEGNFWIGYDNEQSVQEKVKYAKNKNLGGVMIWSIETDDLHGFCGTKKGLLNAIKKAL